MREQIAPQVVAHAAEQVPTQPVEQPLAQVVPQPTAHAALQAVLQPVHCPAHVVPQPT